MKKTATFNMDIENLEFLSKQSNQSETLNKLVTEYRTKTDDPAFALLQLDNQVNELKEKKKQIWAVQEQVLINGAKADRERAEKILEDRKKEEFGEFAYLREQLAKLKPLPYYKQMIEELYGLDFREGYQIYIKWLEKIRNVSEVQFSGTLLLKNIIQGISKEELLKDV